MGTTLDSIIDSIQQVTGTKGIKITRSTVANDVHGWDSMSHVSIILDIEKKFGVKFKAFEVADLATVGELEDLLLGKLKK